MPTVTARPDPALSAVVRSRRALFYSLGADPALDRPAHVRAGSALAWWGDHLVVVQDDANFAAAVHPERGEVGALALPRGEAGARQFDEHRGNKHAKLDLEACVTVPTPDGPALLAFGSGSTPRREVIAWWRGLDARPEVTLVPAGALYAALRARADFSGSELNVEGAALVQGHTVRLFQRGNGAPRGALTPVDATCDLDLEALLSWLRAPERAPLPALSSVTEYVLGEITGGRLTFTDATEVGASVRYLAAAERSPDAVRDGPVEGVALGVISPDGGARYALVRDASGAPLKDKAEGLAFAPGDPATAYVVLDRDDPSVASELCVVTLSGPWGG